MSSINIWLLFCVSVTSNVLSLPHIHKTFKCAGDPTNICDTGLCYDALGFYEGGQNVGCAPVEMCSKQGCLMYQGVFTCCCANRFCNGKTETLMHAKFEMFKKNQNTWPDFKAPRIFARNVTTAFPNTKERLVEPPPSDVRLAPVRKPTTVSIPATAKPVIQAPPPSARKPEPSVIREEARSIEIPEHKISHAFTQAPKSSIVSSAALASNDATITRTSTPISTSTTTKIANLEPAKPRDRPLIIEQEVKTTSSAPAAKIAEPRKEILSTDDKDIGKSTDLSEAKPPMDRPKMDSERTTRSYQPLHSSSSSSPTTSSTTTTTRPRKQHQHSKPPKDGPKIDKVKATHREEVHHPGYFPWYAVTIVGFVISLIFFGIVLLLIRRIRRGKAANASNENVSSVDSSRISEAYPNENGQHHVDPLLTTQNRA